MLAYARLPKDAARQREVSYGFFVISHARRGLGVGLSINQLIQFLVVADECRTAEEVVTELETLGVTLSM